MAQKLLSFPSILTITAKLHSYTIHKIIIKATTKLQHNCEHFCEQSKSFRNQLWLHKSICTINFPPKKKEKEKTFPLFCYRRQTTTVKIIIIIIIITIKKICIIHEIHYQRLFMDDFSRFHFTRFGLFKIIIKKRSSFLRDHCRGIGNNMAMCNLPSSKCSHSNVVVVVTTIIIIIMGKLFVLNHWNKGQPIVHVALALDKILFTRWHW